MSQDSSPEKNRNKIHVAMGVGSEPEPIAVAIIRAASATDMHTIEAVDKITKSTADDEMSKAMADETPECTVKTTTGLVGRAAEPQPKRRSAARIWFSGLGTFVVVAIVIIAIGLVGLRLTGFRTFTVMSGSMEPNYPVGSLIYVKPTNYQDLKVGDVISFVANDDKTVVTHRIIEIEVDEDDMSIWRFKTKGDANASADTKLVHYKNVLGTPIFVIPYIGYIAHNIQQPPGIYVALVVGTLLLAWTFLPGTLEERKKLREKSTI